MFFDQDVFNFLVFDEKFLTKGIFDEKNRCHKIAFRNRKCTCPLGWSTEDKCFTPIINMTEPCQFRGELLHHQNITDKPLLDNFAASGEAALNCGGIRSEGFPNLNLIVPGTTTDLDFSNAGIFEFLSNVAEGAYRLEKINLSNNFIRHLPRDFFRWNQVLKTIDLSRNQIRTLRPDVIHGLTNLENLDLSNNHMSALNKKLLKDAHNLKAHFKNLIFIRWWRHKSEQNGWQF